MHRHCGLYLVKEAPVFLLLTLLAVIDDANIDSSKSVNLVVHYSDGSDPDTVVISDPQLEPFMVGAFPHSNGHAKSVSVGALQQVPARSSVCIYLGDCRGRQQRGLC